jgi:NADH-quinone oxidoreductase subunit H
MIPTGANKVVFIIAPMMTFVLALVGWAVIPFDGLVLADINVGILYLFAISSLGVYGIIMAGWASNSKYAFLGACARRRRWCPTRSRSASSSSPCCSARLAEPHRDRAGQQRMWFVHPAAADVRHLLRLGAGRDQPHPFDLPEAEAELVAGYNVEYSSMTFALFFLGEYANMILMSAMTAILFLGGWLPPFDIAPFTWIPGRSGSSQDRVLLFVFIWVRATCRATATTS